MPGDHIHVLEEAPLPGGACDGLRIPELGFVIRGGREMENHYECLWDLYRSIPSLEAENASVLDEFYWLNKDDPNFSKNRATLERGESADTGNRFDLSDEAALELMRLFFTPDEALYDKTIDDVLDEEFYSSNFWLYWQTMFAFEKWHSALEMKLYLQRFLHHIGGLPDLSALKFTKYNQYESLILPLVSYLKEHGVQFHYGVKVTNVLFHFLPDNKYPPAQPGVFPMRAKPSVLRVTRTTRNTVCQPRGDCYLRPVNGLPGALITICSPSLSSSNWCLIYSAIRPAFFPTVSTYGQYILGKPANGMSNRAIYQPATP